MDSTAQPLDALSALPFQPLKLHIRIGGKAKPISLLEAHLAAHFTMFGFVDDLKVICKSGLNRGFAHLRVRLLPRRDVPP